MWGRKKKQISPWVLCLFLATSANAQSCLSIDSLLNNIHKHKISIKQELDYSVSFSNYLFLNWHHDKNANQVLLLHNLKYKISFSGDSLFHFTGTFLHNLGLQSYFDSLTKIQTDENTLNTCFDIRIRRNLNFSLNSILSSRITNGYDYSADDSGRIVKTLNSSFCTPLIWTFSGGFLLKWPDLGSLNLGVSAAKLTYIRDKSIFDKQKVTKFYGVPLGKDHLIEYGLSLQFLADKDIVKWIRWNCDLLFFKNYNAPIDITLKNNFGIRINKFLKANIQTKLYYEKMVSPGVQLENLITFGFYVHL